MVLLQLRVEKVLQRLVELLVAVPLVAVLDVADDVRVH